MDETSKKEKTLRSVVLNRASYDPKTYEYDDSFREYGGDPMEVHTTHEMLDYLAKNPHTELDANVLHLRRYESGKTKLLPKKMGKANFMEAFHRDAGRGIKMRKGSGRSIDLREYGSFATGGSGYGGFGDQASAGSSFVGQDFTPLLGGPFYKNLYFYTDYIRMHAEAFFTYHNDPIARGLANINKYFVLGTGYEVQCDTTDHIGKLAMATWRAFEDANNLQEQIDQITDESGIYGEIMLWEIPNGATKITYGLRQNDTIPLGIIPRVKLIDPSNIVEIVTYPEDISRVLMYIWLQPTQYQIFTSGFGPSKDSPPMPKNIQPSLKFIYRQIPAEQMMHLRINGVSNEKRGRSDFFPIFNYLKRLRDAVNYQMISLEKVAAWAIDTTIEGDQTDIDAYIADQKSMGTIPPAGSEFVHSKGITRAYQGNKEASSHSSDVLQWCLSMACAGYGVPTSWLGTHLSGGQTRASALVATEPVTKRMEFRREILKRNVIKKLWNLCMRRAGLPQVECDVVLAELITQDRSAKLKDLQLAQQMRWMSPQRCATMAAKEFQAQKYDYTQEVEDMKQEIPEIPMPLLDPGILSPADGVIPTGTKPGGPGAPSGSPLSSGGSLGTAGMSSEEKRGIKQDDTHL
jgi:hypothetical protein